VAIQVTIPETALSIRINWLFLLLAVVMATTISLAPTTMLGLRMVVGRLITSI
jgi:hypothetical protein